MGWLKNTIIGGSLLGIGYGAYNHLNANDDEEEAKAQPFSVTFEANNLNNPAERRALQAAANQRATKEIKKYWGLRSETVSDPNGAILQTCSDDVEASLDKVESKAKAAMAGPALPRAWEAAAKDLPVSLQTVDWAKLAEQIGTGTHRCTPTAPFVPGTYGNNPVLAYSIDPTTMGITPKMASSSTELCARAGALARATYCQESGACEVTTEQITGGGPMATPNAIQESVARVCRGEKFEVPEDASKEEEAAK